MALAARTIAHGIEVHELGEERGKTSAESSRFSRRTAPLSTRLQHVEYYQCPEAEMPRVDCTPGLPQAPPARPPLDLASHLDSQRRQKGSRLARSWSRRQLSDETQAGAVAWLEAWPQVKRHAMQEAPASTHQASLLNQQDACPD